MWANLGIKHVTQATALTTFEVGHIDIAEAYTKESCNNLSVM